MRRFILIAPAFLAGCHGQPSDHRAAENQHEIAQVKAANSALPPVQEVIPEPITDADIQRYDLLGQSCAYAPGTSLGTLVIAREADAFAKIAGEVERFAADPGSRALPQRSRSLYNSKNYSLRLGITGSPSQTENRQADYEGTVELRDPHGRLLYSGTGLARCGP